MPAQFRHSSIVYRKKQHIANNEQPKAKTGFTLVELMIAITIVAIISTIGIIAYSQTQKTARDAKRKADLRSIAIALELYYQRNKFYPKSGPSGWVSTNNPTSWITGLNTNYISKLPVDPINNSTYKYSYYSGDVSAYQLPCPRSDSSGGQFYILYAPLENANDADTLVSKHYPWCDGRALDGHNPYTWDSWCATCFMVSSQ